MDLYKFVKQNKHISAELIQHMLREYCGTIVPVGKVRDLLERIKSEEHTAAQQQFLTSAKGRKVSASQLDEIIQYALKGGMPITFIEG